MTDYGKEKIHLKYIDDKTIVSLNFDIYDHEGTYANLVFTFDEAALTISEHGTIDEKVSFLKGLYERKKEYSENSS